MGDESLKLSGNIDAAFDEALKFFHDKTRVFVETIKLSVCLGKKKKTRFVSVLEFLFSDNFKQTNGI